MVKNIVVDFYPLYIFFRLCTLNDLQLFDFRVKKSSLWTLHYSIKNTIIRCPSVIYYVISVGKASGIKETFFSVLSPKKVCSERQWGGEWWRARAFSLLAAAVSNYLRGCRAACGDARAVSSDCLSLSPSRAEGPIHLSSLVSRREHPRLLSFLCEPKLRLSRVPLAVVRLFFSVIFPKDERMRSKAVLSSSAAMRHSFLCTEMHRLTVTGIVYILSLKLMLEGKVDVEE